MSIFEKLHQQGQQQKQISPDEMRTEIISTWRMKILFSYTEEYQAT